MARLYAQFVNFLNVCISEAHLRCGGNFYTHFAASFILFLAVTYFENWLAKLLPERNSHFFMGHGVYWCLIVVMV